jgi:NAD(P)-dependent dehydrogenase (short-subunit alcohol dehydrogenase family)
MSLKQRISLILSRVNLMIRSLRLIYKQGGYTNIEIRSVASSELLNNKAILITGGGSGIGLAIAKRAISNGAKVVICGRSKKKLEEAAKEINSDNLKYLVLDVSKVNSFQDKLDEASELINGDINVLINNAGIIDGSDFLSVSEATWENIYSVNSKGMFFLTQSLVDKWLKCHNRCERKVLNISSQGGFVGATYPYRLSKWDIVGMTKGLGKRLAPERIIVNGIAPGIVATEMQDNLIKDQSNAYMALNPIQRYALPEEIAELAVFMISDSCNFMVGQTIVCDGGFTLN